MIDFLITLIVLTATAFLVSFRLRHSGFTVAICLYAICLAVAIIGSLRASVISSAWDVPYLGGSDGEEYFEQARLLAQVGILDYQSLIVSNYLGYQLILAILFRIFSPTLLTGLIANGVMLILSVSLLYRATRLITDSAKASLFAVTAMMLTTSHIFYGLVLLKEPTLNLAFSLILLAVAQTLHGGRFILRAAVFLLVALLLIITTRATAFLFVLLVFGFVASLLIKRRAPLIVMFIGIGVLIVPLAQSFSIYQLDADFLVQTVTENSVISSRFEEGDLDLSGIAGQFGSRFVPLPFPVKVALFPLPTIVQMAIPFDFWSGQFLADHPAVFFYRNLNILWLIAVLPWFLFALLNFRRIQIPIVSRFLWSGTAYYVGIAIIYGGLIPRYVAPCLFFIYPAIGYFWARAREEVDMGARAVRFFGQYYVVLVMASLAYLALQLTR